MVRLPEIEYRILAALEAGKALAVADIVKQTGTDQSLVMAGATLLAQRGLVMIAEESQEEFSLTEEGKAAVGGFPERKALAALKDAGGAVNLSELSKLLGKDDARAEVKWLTRKGWCTRDAGVLAVSSKGEDALNTEGADESFVAKLAELGQATESELAAAGVDVKAALELLKGRNELLKRKKRVSRKLSLTEAGTALKAGGIELDPIACKVRRNGSDLDLTATEFRLLEVLMGRPGVVFARGQLLDTVWGYERAVNQRAVDVYILRLRQKIEADPADPRLIRSVRGFGYSFQAEATLSV